MNFDYKTRVSTKIKDSAIGRLLDKMSLESVFCTHSILTLPWGIEMPQLDNCMMFHLVISGQVQLTTNTEKYDLSAGEFVLLPRGEGHKFSCGTSNFYTPLADLPIEIVSDRYEKLCFGGSGPQTVMLCGAIVFKHPLTLRLLDMLPTSILVKQDSKRYEALKSVVRLIELETTQPQGGSTGAISRLADLLVITCLREYIENQETSELSWLGALEDSRISKAIELVHEQPSRHWNLEELSAQVGMSRTSFTGEFKRLVGSSPMEYLTEWRMSLAYGDLQNTKSSILAIALDYGYQSESAFSRAFKRTIGTSPSAIRKQLVE
ncbi:AraC family transcriptional regulator [Paraglaciecola arctica]|uniref:AraC family transcriptional regulator n=1 Tax=Paraglaciecola arctica TaxID=1128911 RepID=UPI001C077D64|nr:AraC family transcriptional regulator [Paraglaciecola arctica]